MDDADFELDPIAVVATAVVVLLFVSAVLFGLILAIDARRLLLLLTTLPLLDVAARWGYLLFRAATTVPIPEGLAQRTHRGARRIRWADVERIDEKKGRVSLVTREVTLVVPTNFFRDSEGLRRRILAQLPAVGARDSAAPGSQNARAGAA